MQPRERGGPSSTWLRVLGGGALSLALGSAALAQEPTSGVEDALKAMGVAAGAPMEVTRSPLTGLATFVSAPPGKMVPVPDASAVTPEDRAASFLAAYGKAFGIGDPSELRVRAVRAADETGMDHVRLQQLYEGIPVTGGELIVHLRGSEVVAVNGKTLPAPRGLDVSPALDPASAAEAARRNLARDLDLGEGELGIPRLEIFNRGMLEGRNLPTHLAWFFEITGPALREFVWVDARLGTVILHFSQLTDAKNRLIYNAFNGSALPGSLVRTEGGPPTGDNDADNGYVYLGDTYDYFFNEHARDSFDGAGAALIATVHYCPSPTPANCPYKNAFWNGTQMVFGEGYTNADDVTAHELTHAVTDRTAELFYYMQSGALNESFSDIFGEAMDLGNGRGTDTPAVRWLLGEDVPGTGAIRNMSNPNQYNDPGRIGDIFFDCRDDYRGDRGGVHTNSGVPNHAFALMVDGGFYNGINVTGIGLAKAGKIQYRTLALYLFSAADFLDNYNAVKRACTDLVGTAGITAADCVQVGNALDAVNMSSTWPCFPSQPTVPSLCPAGKLPQTQFFDDFESGSSNWTFPLAQGMHPWTLGSFLGPFATSGRNMLWGYDPFLVTDSRAEMAVSVPIPAGDVRMQFNHSFGFENTGTTYWDGGVIEYSVDGGATWTDAGSLITQGATYRGVLRSDFQNPLGGRSAFGRDSYGYTASQLNLASLTGQNARFRFRIGADNTRDEFGWFVDDVRIYTCVNPSVNVTSPNGGESIPAGSVHQIRWTGIVSPDAQIEVSYSDGVNPLTPIATLPSLAREYLWGVPNMPGATLRVQVASRVGATTEASDLSDGTFTITAAVPPPPHVDFNRDSQPDLLWHHQVTGALFIWSLTGTLVTAGSFLTPPAQADVDWRVRGIADFDRDGKPDILWHNQATGDLFVWFMNGLVISSGSFLTPPRQADTLWQIRGTSDLNMDGKVDILWHHQGTGDLFAWFLNGTVVIGGDFLTPARQPDTLWQIRSLADLNNDGNPDLLWHHQGRGDLYVWGLTGTMVTWGSYLTPNRQPDTGWQLRRVADLNNDGVQDLLWHHQVTGGLFVWFLDRLAAVNGSFLSPPFQQDVNWQIMPR